MLCSQLCLPHDLPVLILRQLALDHGGSYHPSLDFLLHALALHHGVPALAAQDAVSLVQQDVDL